MVNAGIQHFIKANFYVPFVPDFLPFKDFIILGSGVLELGLGLLLFFKNDLAKYAGLGIFLLMLVFLPIHIKDVFVENPSIGSHKLAIIRLPIQFIFLAWSWAIWKYLNKQKEISVNN
ncbi:hypothetical protein B0A78_02335 [Flavobacterium columnare NBRC 100251 = ATCC 23463]|uniref:DoxX family membrane protein n=2 Tax=Flavobacterium columnare TaxID=996 RepID=G8X946_FLACA|nr:hypothetical protein FCOL_01240 [Flavobacterium columnare ATCC 49512]ANO49127.1 hypothetical protein Pf1_00879 [Flavobacterium columnare]AUX17422.1 hypothetical protein AQ623_03300 [Flavobacterium columnare]PDS26364.1 hypothetical protein B0A78_02335 [Flavobacterium columnare NBRC 100251 = ATCC 23463]